MYQRVVEDPKWNKKVIKLGLALMKFVDDNDPHKACFGDDLEDDVERSERLHLSQSLVETGMEEDLLVE